MPRDSELHKCAYKGDVEGVRHCIEEDHIDVNEFGAANRTALHRAVAINCTAVVELLISKNANINIKDKNGRSPLHWAAVVGSSNCAEQLVQAGADINSASNTLSTPLHMAADLGKIEFVEFALQNGADSTMMDKGGMTAFDLAKLADHRSICAILKPGGGSGGNGCHISFCCL